MFEIERNDNALVLEIPSSMNNIGATLKTVKKFIETFEVPETLTIQNTIVLRELLVNAIQHGHNFDVMQKVDVRIEHIKDKQFKIIVRDQGKGFDHLHLNHSFLIPGDVRNIQKRGYILLKALTKCIEFNEKGNCVTVITLPHKAIIESSE
jgi:anti-sigma regulatory factor (Ser/Thr protein kinase)